MITIRSSRQIVLCALLGGLLSGPTGLSAGEVQPERDQAPDDERARSIPVEESTPVVRGPVPIRPPRVLSAPAEGQGRLSIEFDGNRRWCTFPDDRLQNPLTPEASRLKGRRAVYTFGYQFSIAAVKPSQPDTTLLLFSSPEITTATLRQAGKLGRGKTTGRTTSLNPKAVPDDAARKDPRDRETAATLVPYWDEAQRCASVGEQFDFDLDPGRYDVYIAFDIKLASGAWVHRTYAYLTGIDIEQGSRTVVDGVIDMHGGGRRDLRLRTASIEAPAVEGAARR